MRKGDKMLNKLAKNQYVKITKDKKSEEKVEYGIVLGEHDGMYDIMSIGFESKNGKYIDYPTDAHNMVQSYATSDAQFDEVKENEVRRKMNIWLDGSQKK